MLLETLAEVIGIESAISLAIAFAGERLYVPHTISAEHEIADVLGLPKAQKLAQHFGAETLEIPKFKSRSTLNKRLRDFQEQSLRQAKALGFSRRDCAKIFNISRQSLIVRDRKSRSRFTLASRHSKPLGCKQLEFGI